MREARNEQRGVVKAGGRVENEDDSTMGIMEEFGRGSFDNDG